MKATLAILAFVLLSGCTTGQADDVKGQAAKGSHKTELIKPGIKNGQPVGLFFMTRYWSFSGTLEKAAWFFSPDGHVYQNLESGFSASDLAAHDGPQGTFKIAGTEMEITWSDGQSTKNDLEIEGDGFMWDMGIFSPVLPAEPKSIAGIYEGGESLSHGGNSVAVAHKLEFTSNGKFTWSGVSSLEGTTSETELSSSAEGSTSGTWELDGYTMTLTSESGETTRKIVFPYDDEETAVKPDRIFFGGMMLKHQ